MILSLTALVKCDSCGKVHSVPTYPGYEVYEMLENEGWIIASDADICPKCVDDFGPPEGDEK